MLNDNYKSLERIYENLRTLVDEFKGRISSGELLREEDITSRFLERLAKELTVRDGDFELESMAITIDKYTEEPNLGADILVVTSFTSPTITVSKGFLVQAKNLNKDRALRSSEMVKLREQCSAMLEETIESYVWLFSEESFRVHKAFVLERLSSNVPDDLFFRYLTNFLIDYLKCHHGDPHLSFEVCPRLKEIVEKMRIPNVLLLSASTKGEENPPDGGGAPEPEGPKPDLGSMAASFTQLNEGTTRAMNEQFQTQRDFMQDETSLQERVAKPRQVHLKVGK